MSCLTSEAPFPGGRQNSYCSILLKRGHWGELRDLRQKEEGNFNHWWKGKEKRKSVEVAAVHIVHRIKSWVDTTTAAEETGVSLIATHLLLLAVQCNNFSY